MYLGDFAAGGLIDFNFCTVDGTGAPTALTGGVISVYKGSSTAQSTTGVSLTSPFDSVTGLSHVTIDTSADGTFYADGSQFEAVITTGTVGGISVVGYVVGRFTLRAQAPLYPTTAGRKLDVSTGGEAGVDWANVGSPTTANNLSATTIATTQQVDVNTIKTQTVTCAAGVTVNVNVGTTQPLNFTGTAGSALVKSDTIDWNSVAVTGMPMPTYTQPTGFLAATFPTTVASTTNITAGTITTVSGNVTGNVGGNVTGTVGGMTAAGWATAFTTNTTKVYSDAVAGSVVYELANGAWDVVLASHVTPGSTGAALSAAGGSGDPWITPLPGSYAVGTAGHIIGTALPDIAPGSANGLLRGGTNTATTFATLTSTGAFTISGVSNISQTGDSFARIGNTGSALTSLAQASIWTGTLATNIGTTNSTVATNLNATITSRQATFTSDTGITFPTNFSVLAISGAGAVTAGTVSDKTGYSLSATQTFNNTGTWTGNLTGSVGSVTAGVTLATGALTDTAIATTGANRIADTTRRRTQANVEASSYGDSLALSSLYGFVQQAQESNTVDTPGFLSVYQTNGTSLLGVRTLGTDPTAEPVTSVS